MGQKITKIMQPVILNEGEFKTSDIQKIIDNYSIWRESDLYKLQLEELFEITYPHLILDKNYKSELLKFVNNKSGSTPKLKGAWVYLPWSGYLLHTVGAKDYVDLRTNRNKNLIKQEEQQSINKEIGRAHV